MGNERVSKPSRPACICFPTFNPRYPCNAWLLRFQRFSFQRLSFSSQLLNLSTTQLLKSASAARTSTSQPAWPCHSIVTLCQLTAELAIA